MEKNIKIWLKFLVNTPLYKYYNIKVNDKFFNNIEDHSIDINELSEKIPIEETLISKQQTLLWNEDKFLCIAPAEKNTPKSLLFDEHAEELSFPSIYVGQFQNYKENLTVTPFMSATSELRRTNRRGATPNHLLYMAMKIIRDALTIAFKHIGYNTNITKAEVVRKEYITNCIEANLAFLKSIPNSVWYWRSRKKDLFAMIRQFNKPTAFMTLS